MTVTIAVPFYGPEDLLDKAVRSILAQTYRDIHVLVIGDGVEPDLSGIADLRLDVYSYPVNRGPYFALQLALLASGHQWFSPHGADDWSDPERMERLVALTRGADGVVTGAVRVHVGRSDTEGFEHRGAFEVGLYRRSRLLSFGGYNPAERIGQDTLMLRLLRLTAGAAVATSLDPSYHRLKHPGTLTTSIETGHGSILRNEMRARNRAVFRKAEQLRDAAAIREYRRDLVPAAIRYELAEHVQRLSTRLAVAA